ncbi:ATP-dependent DNA helicase pif1-like [Metopolophium dirhodum]|uniref:ATP-dependent DNA helicase pif1-like n=1 Tax=Metopolophium dirhodum TaxID=44670 RepID=UPI00298F7103|nr:ATP-dependent DNA helicase pif1-like [Metopolophium dirhodum]
MTEDFLIRMRHHTGNSDLIITLEMYNEALIAIEDMCLTIANKALRQLGMISPNRPMHDFFDRELRREHHYDINELQTFVNLNVPKLNDHQKNVYDTIMQAVQNEAGGLYFLDAPGGMGKTFVISLILANIRAQGKITLALASSGIAATLLDGGRTAHSALKLPLKVQVIENPTCNISRNSAMAKVLQQTAIILLDECTMTHKKLLEAIHRTMQDLRGNQNIFGGALILLSGDFRQTLSVIPRTTPADEINACLKSSFMWRYVRKFTLNINMRVQLQNDQSADRFSKQLLEIGNGKVQIDNTNGLISLPNNFCTILQSKEELIERVFPNIIQNHRNHNWLSGAILAPKNVHVNAINYLIQEKLPGAVISYKSIDSALNEEDAVNYPVEFLNSLEPPGIPPHFLNLKVGSSIILLRNLNAPKLCNGTRLSVKRLMPNLIEATILTGKAKGEFVLIPRIPLIPTDMPFEFKRLQFPVRLSFAMSINKAQGQTLQVCDCDIEAPLSTFTSQNEISTTSTAMSTNYDIEIPQGTDDQMAPKKLSGAQNQKRKKNIELENKLLATQWKKWMNKSNQRNSSSNSTINCNENNSNEVIEEILSNELLENSDESISVNKILKETEILDACNVEIEKNIKNESQVTEEIFEIDFNDPSSWPPITDKIRTLLINHGPETCKTLIFIFLKM